MNREPIIEEKENREFSYEQLRIIDRFEKECRDADCGDNGHKC